MAATSLVLFRGFQDEVGEKLLRTIHKDIPELSIETFLTIEALIQWLRYREGGKRAVVLLVPATDDQLHKMIPFINLLEDLRVLLVLPNHETHTIGCGYKFKPSFLMFRDEDSRNLSLVLSKIVSNGPAK